MFRPCKANPMSPEGEAIAGGHGRWKWRTSGWNEGEEG
uniref:Uncharacterized protein n=1 Tax=Rhizophora mucronata TaxID=61149 RepID=A0A2P2PP26_RHIMU